MSPTDSLRQQIVDRFATQLELAEVSEASLMDALQQDDLLFAKLVTLVSRPQLLLKEPADRSQLPRDQEGLIHGKYLDHPQILDALAAHCARVHRDVRQLKWAGPSDPPDFDATHPNRVVVLEVMWETLGDTLAFIYSWLSHEYGEIKGRYGFTADQWDEYGYESYLSRGDLIQVKETALAPNTMRWRVLDLDERRDVSSVDNIERPYGLALLYCFAQHPKHFKIDLGRSRSLNYWIRDFALPKRIISKIYGDSPRGQLAKLFILFPRGRLEIGTET